MKTFYKIVSESKTSVIATGDLTVNYKIGTWVKAPKFSRSKGYHLLVFNTLAAAKKSGNRFYNSAVIYSCEVRGLIPPSKTPSELGAHPCEFLRWFKQVKSGVVSKYCIYSWPAGTRMVREVKLIKPICKLNGDSINIAPLNNLYIRMCMEGSDGDVR